MYKNHGESLSAFLRMSLRRVFGLSASAERPMDSRLCVRPSVRPCVRPSVRPCVTPYLEIRASDFDDFFTDVRYYCS